MRQSKRTKSREAPKTGRQPSGAEMQERIDALEAELAEARAQQTAAAEVLQVINSSRRSHAGFRRDAGKSDAPLRHGAGRDFCLRR